MRAFIFSWVAALSMLLLPSSASTATRAGYTFQVIADTSGPYSAFRDFAINDSGTVAFVAQLDAGSAGVFSTRGSQLTTITSSGAGDFVSINNSGTVAFNKATALDNSGGGLFTGRGGALTTVVSEGSIYYPSINNSGSIAFRRVLGSDDGPPQAFAYVAINGRVTQIPDSANACEPAINNSNTVLVARCAPLVGTIGVSNGGERPTLLADTNGQFDSLYATAINDAGTIAFFGHRKTLERGIYTLEHGQVRTIASISSGQTGGYYAFTPRLSLNNRGDVAFAAYLSPDRLGIFTGADPIADKVIAVGDPLAGSTVTAISFAREALNANGDLVFAATLANGKQVLVLASQATGKA